MAGAEFWKRRVSGARSEGGAAACSAASTASRLAAVPETTAQRKAKLENQLKVMVDLASTRLDWTRQTERVMKRRVDVLRTQPLSIETNDDTETELVPNPAAPAERLNKKRKKRINEGKGAKTSRSHKAKKNRLINNNKHLSLVG